MMPRRLHKERLGRMVKQNWDCSRIENEQEEEEDDWQKENQMGMQWDEDEKLEEILERRRVERCSLQAEVMRKRYQSKWDMNECPRVTKRSEQKKRRK